jgi:hypothetical protein
LFERTSNQLLRLIVAPATLIIKIAKGNEIHFFINAVVFVVGAAALLVTGLA